MIATCKNCGVQYDYSAEEIGTELECSCGSKFVLERPVTARRTVTLPLPMIFFAMTLSFVIGVLVVYGYLLIHPRQSSNEAPKPLAIAAPAEVRIPYPVIPLPSDGDPLYSIREISSVVLLFPKSPNITEKVLVNNIADDIKRDTEIKLRKAGLRIHDHVSDDLPFLAINLFGVLDDESSIFSYALIVELIGPAVGPNGMRSDVPLWNTAMAGTAGKLKYQTLRSLTSDQVDEFLNAWMAANPPIAENKTQPPPNFSLFAPD